jgi:hypothetical protein
MSIHFLIRCVTASVVAAQGIQIVMQVNAVRRYATVAAL